MRNAILGVLALLLLATYSAEAQTKHSVRWEELTSADFRDAIAQSQGTCLLPFGILEKHGPHLPLGTDLLDVRYAALHAAELNYAVVFPEYYFGQIFEAKHEAGTIAYSAALQLQLLQETTDEMARNGCKKIIIVNGHGGNENLLPYFAQSQLDKPHDYVVYVQWGARRTAGRSRERRPREHARGRNRDFHDDDRAAGPGASGSRRERIGRRSESRDLPDDVYAGIWWYARFPNHYSGNGALATKELGTFEMNAWIAAIDGSDSRSESRRPEPQIADRILREEQASARHAAVSAAFVSRGIEQSCYGKL